MTRNPIFHTRSKYKHIRQHFIREYVEKKIVEIKYLPTEDLVADILTNLYLKLNFSFVQPYSVKLNRYSA